MRIHTILVAMLFATLPFGVGARAADNSPVVKTSGGNAGLPKWTPYQGGSRSFMVFGDTTGERVLARAQTTSY